MRDMNCCLNVISIHCFRIPVGPTSKVPENTPKVIAIILLNITHGQM